MEKKGTLRQKRRPKGDPNPQKGPLGDPGPLKGTQLGTVHQACKVNAAYDAYEFSSETRHWTAAQWSLCTGPMVDLMCSDLTFCQCFFSKETRKFMAG